MGHRCCLNGVAHTEKYSGIGVTGIRFLNNGLQSISSVVLQSVVFVHRRIRVHQVAAQSDLLNRELGGRQHARVVRSFRVDVELDLLSVVAVGGGRVHQNWGVVLSILHTAIVRVAARDRPPVIIVHHGDDEVEDWVPAIWQGVPVEVSKWPSKKAH